MVGIITIGYIVYKSTNATPEISNKNNTLKNNSDKQVQIGEVRIGKSPSMPLKVPEGYSIGIFAENLPGARDLEFSSNGTLLVSLSNRGEVLALKDSDRDGDVDENEVILSSLRKPHGLAFYNGMLFVAEENKVSRYIFEETSLKAKLDKKLFDLPTGGRHTTRSIVFDKKGNLFVSLGSTCDTCIEKEPFISKVLISDSEGKKPKIYSSGLRNAVFLAINPVDNKVWVTEMGRDNLGDNLPPDEINILSNGTNYGWPFCYGNKVIDKSQKAPNATFCGKSIEPYYEIPAHSAPLGLTFINSAQFPQESQNDLLVAYHGSWNRTTPTGFKVVQISMNGTPTEKDLITGFGTGRSAEGRPVDVIFDNEGSLFISDDKGDSIYKMIKRN